MRRVRLALIGVVFAVTTTGSWSHPTRATAGAASGDATLQVAVRGATLRLGISNGAMARLAIGNAQTYGLRPVVASDGLTLTITELFVDPVTGSERAREITRIALKVGQAAYVEETTPPLEVELIGVSFPSARESQDPNNPCTRCCVTCDGITTCACWVEADCGRCCCPFACDCPWGLGTGACPTDGTVASSMRSNRPRAGARSPFGEAPEPVTRSPGRNLIRTGRAAQCELPVVYVDLRRGRKRTDVQDFDLGHHGVDDDSAVAGRGENRPLCASMAASRRSGAPG